MTFPKKIEVCPIVDSVVEIRFSADIFANAVFGLIYSKLQKDFPKAQKLPILQIPEQIRESDPGLKFKPHYLLMGEDYSVQVGPDVLAINSNSPYKGWSKFSKTIFGVLENVFSLGVINSVSRLGIRYTNFFDNTDVYNKINLKISINDGQLNYTNTLFKTEIQRNNFTNILQISNNSEINREGLLSKGSIIDIDTYKEYAGNNFFLTSYKEEIENGHNAEKSLFFSLLTQEFLNELNPTY